MRVFLQLAGMTGQKCLLWVNLLFSVLQTGRVDASAIVDQLMRGENPLSNVGVRTRPVFTDGPAFNLPANGKGTDRIGYAMSPVLPGIQLPGEHNQAPTQNRNLFNPFTSVVDSTVYTYASGTQAVGVGQGIHGTNALNIPVDKLYNVLRRQDIPKPTHKQSELLPQNPFTTVVGQGIEMERVDTMLTGRLTFPVHDKNGNGVKFDLSGYALGFNPRPDTLVSSGQLNVPLVDLGKMWTMTGKETSQPGNIEAPLQYAHQSNPVNPLNVPIDEVFNEISKPHDPLAPMNPIFIGKGQWGVYKNINTELNLVEIPELQIYTGPSDITVLEGSNVCLECETGIGQPLATITWLKNGQPLILPDSRSTNEATDVAPRSLSKSSTKARLLLPCVTLADAGLYTCLASNGIATVSRNATVLVHGSPAVDNTLDFAARRPCQQAMSEGASASPNGHSPKMYLWTSDAIEREGAKVYLLCRAEGNPKPTITWYRVNSEGENVDEELPIESDDPLFKTLPNGDLIIESPDVNSLGPSKTLKCVAKNKHGADAVDSFVMITTVKGDPLFEE